jgi:hypothetical protein
MIPENDAVHFVLNDLGIARMVLKKCFQPNARTILAGLYVCSPPKYNGGATTSIPNASYSSLKE